MTINTKFTSPVETFCDDDSLKVFSNVVPEQEKQYWSYWFSEKRKLIELKTKKGYIKLS